MSRESFYEFLNKACDIVNKETKDINVGIKNNKLKSVKPKNNKKKTVKPKTEQKLLCYLCFTRSITTGYCTVHSGSHCTKCSNDDCGEDYWNPK